MALDRDHISLLANQLFRIPNSAKREIVSQILPSEKKEQKIPTMLWEMKNGRKTYLTVLSAEAVMKMFLSVGCHLAQEMGATWPLRQQMEPNQ
jgi:hypothetical protein